MANNAAKNERESRLAINCIAGTAFMMLSAIKQFQGQGFPAQWRACVEGLAVVTQQFCPGDPGASEEVMQRIAEAIKPTGPAIIQPTGPAKMND